MKPNSIGPAGRLLLIFVGLVSLCRADPAFDIRQLVSGHHSVLWSTDTAAEPEDGSELAEFRRSSEFLDRFGTRFGYLGSVRTEVDKWSIVKVRRSFSDDSIFSPEAEYGKQQFSEQATSARYEYAGLFAAITVIGFANWDWGSSDFTFNSEGWFNETSRGSGGMDKLGHAFSSYIMTDVLTWAIRNRSADSRYAEVTAGLMALSLSTYIEVFDGFSDDHGFSYEDMIMNAAGVGFSMLRNAVPGMAEKVDFRMQYLPSPYDTFNPLGDYPGQKYLLAVKLAGFEGFRDTPLRYVELHGGYYARGFTSDERPERVDQERNLYIGIGLNLSELIFGESPPTRLSGKVIRTGLRYVQVPYTYLSSDGNSGR